MRANLGLLLALLLALQDSVLAFLPIEIPFIYLAFGGVTAGAVGAGAALGVAVGYYILKRKELDVGAKPLV
jgi:hypothetical protein